MNPNTMPATQKQIRYSSGFSTCTPTNSMLPRHSTVDCMSDMMTVAPHRPKNSSCDFGFSSPASRFARSETTGFTRTIISRAPTHKASVVYSGAMAEPKLSAANTATRSTPTGADTALASAVGSDPMTSLRLSSFPEFSAALMRAERSSSLSADARSSFAMVSMESCAVDNLPETVFAEDSRLSLTPESWLAREESWLAAVETLFASSSRPGFRFSS